MKAIVICLLLVGAVGLVGCGPQKDPNDETDSIKKADYKPDASKPASKVNPANQQAEAPL